MSASPTSEAGRLRAARRSTSAAFWRRPWLRGSALLAPPLLWFVVIYLLALVALFVSAFWTVDPFTTEIVKTWNIGNFKTILGIDQSGAWWADNATYVRIALRTIGLALAVTVTDAVVAFPLAYFMARLASSRTRTLIFVCVLIPLWASYLARVYSWRLILAEDGVLNWTLGKLHLPTLGVGYSTWAMWIVFSYIWMPFMILPVYAALERIPGSYLEASRDLGARGGRTLRSVILPLALPGIAAGSIFTFALTLGDFITPQLVGGGEQFIANVVYSNVGIANNVPFAAAYAMVPVLVMVVYLAVAKRLGAFEAL